MRMKVPARFCDVDTPSSKDSNRYLVLSKLQSITRLIATIIQSKI